MEVAAQCVRLVVLLDFPLLRCSSGMPLNVLGPSILSVAQKRVRDRIIGEK